MATRRLALAGIFLVGLGIAGCGTSHKSSAPTTSASTTAPATTTTTEAPPTTTVPQTVASTSPASTSTTTSTVVSVTSAPATVVDCQGDPAASRPTGLTLACGDGGVALSAITWSSWGAATATGRGTLGENNCTPNCAQGTFVTEPASVSLSALTVAGGSGRYGYIAVNPLAPNSKRFTAIHESLPAG